MQQNVIITRRRLWDLVWTEPMYKVASSCGVSYKALIRRCQENEVPWPPRGYWKKIVAGQLARRTPLPKRSAGAPINIELFGRARSRSLLHPIDPVSGREINIPIPATKGAPKHPLTIRTRKLLAGRRTDDAGILVSNKALLNHLMVSPSTLPRALRFLDALFSVLDQPPFVVSWPEPSNARLDVLVRGERFAFVLMELVAPKSPGRHQPPRSHPGQAAQVPNREYRLTGTLRLLLTDFPVCRVRHMWTDRRLHHIEDSLVSVAATLLSATQRLNLERAEGKTWRHQWEEKRRMEEAETEARQQPVRKMDVVRQFAWNWAEGLVLKDFLMQLSRSIARLKNPQERRRGRELVAWVRTQIAKEDSAENIKRLLEGFQRA